MHGWSSVSAPRETRAISPLEDVNSEAWTVCTNRHNKTCHLKCLSGIRIYIYIYIYVYISLYIYIYRYRYLYLYLYLYLRFLGPSEPRTTEASCPVSCPAARPGAESFMLRIENYQRDPDPEMITKQATGDNVFHVCCLLSKRNSLWVWVSFIVFTHQSSRSKCLLPTRSLRRVGRLLASRSPSPC